MSASQSFRTYSGFNDQPADQRGGLSAATRSADMQRSDPPGQGPTSGAKGAAFTRGYRSTTMCVSCSPRLVSSSRSWPTQARSPWDSPRTQRGGQGRWAPREAWQSEVDHSEAAKLSSLGELVEAMVPGILGLAMDRFERPCGAAQPPVVNTSSGVQTGTCGNTGRPPGIQTFPARERWHASIQYRGTTRKPRCHLSPPLFLSQNWRQSPCRC